MFICSHINIGQASVTVWLEFCCSPHRLFGQCCQLSVDSWSHDDVHSPLLTYGHFLHKIVILVLMVFPACWMARLPSLYRLMMETVAYILPPLMVAVMTVPLITVTNTHTQW